MAVALMQGHQWVSM